MTEPRHGHGQEAPEPEAGGPAGAALLTRESATGEPDGPGPLAPRSLARTPSPWRTAFIALAAAGLVAGVVWALFGSRLFVVRSVVVDGTHLVPVGEVRAVAAIPSGLPMIRVGTGAVASRVEAIAQVKSAQVAKSWPDQIVITVHERTPSLAVPVPASAARGGGYDLVDASGITVRWSRTRPAGMPVYQAAAGQGNQGSRGGPGGAGDPGALRGSPEVAAAVTVLHEVPAAVARSIAAIVVPSPQAVTLRLASGVTIVWGSTDGASAKARELAILMRTHARYYDVSAPGSAVTR
jgi:cell division protein FtsQ